MSLETKSKLVNLLGANLLDNHQELLPIDTLLANKSIIGLYFSASYCPPCGIFTPLLAEKYADINALIDNFEIVLIPSDKTQEKFEAYFSKQPWYSTELSASNAIRIKYNVKTIPALIFIDTNNNCNVIELLGRDLVRDHSAKEIISALMINTDF